MSPDKCLNVYERFVFPVLSHVDAEVCHRVTLRLLMLAEATPVRGFVDSAFMVNDRRLRVTIGGVEFSNPVMLAPGFDKNGVAVRPLERLGFGGVEIGSATEKSRKGYPGKRIWRMVEERGLANYMQLPNVGITGVVENAKKNAPRRAKLGISVSPIIENGMTMDDVVSQVGRMVIAASCAADYISLNIVCPNVEHGIDTKKPDILYKILWNVNRQLNYVERESGVRPALFFRIAGGVEGTMLDETAKALINTRVNAASGFNTFSDWPDRIRERYFDARGGLSGRPIKKRTIELLAQLHQITGDRIDLIGSGGVENTEDGLEMMRAGAKGVQIYTGMVYRGPSVVREINRGLIAAMERMGAGSVGRLRKLIMNQPVKLDLGRLSVLESSSYVD